MQLREFFHLFCHSFNGLAAKVRSVILWDGCEEGKQENGLNYGLDIFSC